MSQRNFQKYFMIYFILFGIVISFVGAFTNYFFQMEELKVSNDRKAKEIFEIKIDTILKPAISNMESTIKSLSVNETILDFLNKNNSQKEEELEQIFLAVANSHNNIFQIRLISKEGKEIIRVDKPNRNEQLSFVMSKDKLQDKRERDYFKIVSKMNEQKIWYSKIDLNVENGKIEIPYIPTLRVAMPLFKNNSFNGMIIVNENLTEVFNAIGKSSQFEHYIIDYDNNFILHSNNEYSLNKYKNIKRDFKEDFPKGLKQKDIYSYSLSNILSNSDNATFILKLKDSYQNNLIENKIKTLVIILILTIILSTIISIIISKNPVKLQMALLKAHEKLNEFASIIDKYVITAKTKKDNTIIEVSEAFVESSGYSKKELIGKKMNIIKHPEEDITKYDELWNTIKTGKTWEGEIKNINKNNETYWLKQNIIPTIDKDTKEEIFVSVGTDITAKKQLEQVASIDKLTGLYNRRMIDEFINIEVETHKRNPYDGLSVIMIDIDYFKNVNDTFGHQIGDIVLSQTAKLMIENSRKSDIKGRFGGEEFIIICPQTTAESALKLAEKIRTAIESFKFEEVGYKTISLGISTFENNDTVESLIKKADTALYQAKNSGRNKVVLYKI
ncbi:sensor domain-containing diguanylate cyclase [Aliarcobacter butzleri]|uniref:sensor domain-containing diguanylate cyclase n=1 Tax=Aliarcobacter butzleri TaxID=28197 RepID=UPI0018A03BC9|nr:diguanylate cyclase [Aliarcobacter butzleri]MBF7071494.1 diguanylate cyclase [Aliarcobacter butzleri]